MDYNDIIMSLLEENGLDKRFRENPEAVSQICSMISSDVAERSGKPLRNLNRDEMIETTRKVLSERDYSLNSGVRPNNSYTVNQDGSLSVKHKTDVRRSEVDESRADSEQIFSIGSKRGDLIVTESREYIDQTRDNTFASTSLRFNIFNNKGLEIQSRSISQNVSVDRTAGIRTTTDAFDAIARGAKYELSPIEETTLERGADLATEQYSVQESKGGRLLAYEKGGMVRDHRSEDAISNPIPLSFSLGARLEGQVQRGVMPNFPPQYRPGHLMGYTPDMAEVYSKQTEQERAIAIKNIYEITSSKSPAFRETLFDAAKTDPSLQKVVESLDLVRTTSEKDARLMQTLGIVKVEDLKRVYERVSDKDLKATLQSVIDTSKEANKGKDSQGMEI